MPSDRGNGLAMRAGFFLDAYSRRFDVDIFIAPVSGSVERTPFVQSRIQRLEVLDIKIDTHYRLLSSICNRACRLEAFRRYGRPSLAACAEHLRARLEWMTDRLSYDVVHVFRLYLAELASPWTVHDRSRPRLILDCDENDSFAYRRIAAMERKRPDYAAADWAEAEAAAFDKLAAAWLPKFDLAFAASREEAKSLSEFGLDVQVVPNLLSASPAFLPTTRNGPRKILFVGTLGYAPNADAVSWFVSRVWPRLQRALNYHVRLTIVGRNPPKPIDRLRFRRGITIAKNVADVSSYYRTSDIAIAPLRAGAGTRFKIVEAAMYGVPMVATSFGIQGTTFQPNVELLVADTHELFLRSCLSLLRDRQRSRTLATRARIKARRECSPSFWRAKVGKLVAGE
jgi:glycosyltransferase involved in cell wall biosynthesis